MTALFTFSRLRSLLVLGAFLFTSSSLFAQDDQQVSLQTEQISTDNSSPNNRKAALEAEKNANDLRKITLLLAIAQDRDRQAGEATEDIRSRRLRIEEDLTDAEDNPTSLTKKQRSDLESQYKSLQKKEKLAQKARASANTFLLEVTQAVAAEPSKRSKFLGTYERKHGPVNDSKSVETLPSDAYVTTETGKSRSVAAVDEPKMSGENTPSVSPSISTDNTLEMPTDIAVVSSKNKKERKPKNNESPKKESKKKTKKAAKKIEATPSTEEFPMVFSEPTTTESKTETTNTDPSVATTNESPMVDLEPKSGKSEAKSGKKSKKRAEETPQVTLVSYRTYDRAIDVFMNSPAPECAIAFEGKDDFTGKMKRETSPTRFFTHTDDMMRKALGDKDFITCDITGTKVESSRYTYLNMTFTILSKDIQRTLGFLDRGTPIIFVLVDGTKITLRANKTDIGVVDIDKGTTTYKAQLTAESITDITGSELDYIRVNWTSGYEDYEIFDVDVLKNLFNCLYKK